MSNNRYSYLNDDGNDFKSFKRQLKPRTLSSISDKQEFTLKVKLLNLIMQ